MGKSADLVAWAFIIVAAGVVIAVIVYMFWPIFKPRPKPRIIPAHKWHPPEFK